MALGAGLSVSPDGSLLVSMSDDKSIKVFDVPNIDMMAMLRLSYVPASVEWIFRVRYPILLGPACPNVAPLWYSPSLIGISTMFLLGSW